MGLSRISASLLEDEYATCFALKSLIRKLKLWFLLHVFVPLKSAVKHTTVFTICLLCIERCDVPEIVILSIFHVEKSFLKMYAWWKWRGTMKCVSPENTNPCGHLCVSHCAAGEAAVVVLPLVFLIPSTRYILNHKSDPVLVSISENKLYAFGKWIGVFCYSLTFIC